MTTTNTNTNTIPATETIMDIIAKIKADKITLTADTDNPQAFSATCSITIPETATELERKAYNSAIVTAAKSKLDKYHADTYHGHSSYIAAVKNHSYELTAAGKSCTYVVPLLPMLTYEQRGEYRAAMLMLQRFAGFSKNLTASTEKEEIEARAKCDAALKSALQRAFALIQGDATDNLHVNNRDARLFDSVRPTTGKITTMGDAATASMIEFVCCQKINGNPYLVHLYTSDKKYNDMAETGEGLDLLPAKKPAKKA